MMPRSVLLSGTFSVFVLDWEAFASSTGFMSSMIGTSVSMVAAASACSAGVTLWISTVSV